MAKKTNTQRIEDLEAKLNDTHSKIERQLIENTRISRFRSIFEIVLRIAEFLIIAILGTWLTCNSNKLLKNSNIIMEKSNEIQKSGTDRSIEIMDKSNLIMAHTDSLMNNSNNISLSGLDIQKNSITVMENSNQLIELSNKLEESSRKSNFISTIESTIKNLTDEAKEYNNFNESAELSESIIASISSQTQLLTPYYAMEDVEKNGIYLSPGRGMLFSSLFSVKIDEKSLLKIFKKSDFTYSDLRQVNIDSIMLMDVKLSHSFFSGASIKNSRISNTDFNYADLNNAKFEKCIFNKQTTFNKCKMDNVSFKGCIIEDNVEFIKTPFINVNLENAKFKNIKTYRLDGPFYNCNLSCTEFENVIFYNTEFKNCRWEGAKFTKCSLGISNLSINDIDKFKDQPKSNIQGLRGNSREICDNVKVKLYNCTLSLNNSLLSDAHFLKYHTLKDTIVSNKKVIIANFIGPK